VGRNYIPRSKNQRAFLKLPAQILIRGETSSIQDATQQQQSFVDVGPFFIAHAQPPELIQPSEGPFDHPSPSPQSAAMFGVALREPRHNAAGTQTLPD
jgi:hypothetical protein